MAAEIVKTTDLKLNTNNSGSTSPDIKNNFVNGDTADINLKKSDEGSNENLVKISYYPGCSLNSTAIDFNVSIKKLLKVLGIWLEEIPDWNCCGTTPANNVSSDMPVALSARNLFLAKKIGFNEILSPCVSCYCKLYKAANVLNNAETAEITSHKKNIKRDEIIELFKDIGADPDEKLDFRIYSIVEFLLNNNKLIRKKYIEFKDRVKEPERTLLDGLKPVCYYGCVLFRTNYVSRFDSMENPTSMERVLESIDIKSREFDFKTECCGAILSLTYKNIVLELSKKILDASVEAGANCIIVCCPLCQQNLDMRQKQINKHFKTNYKIPVYYITQVLGMAMGLSYRDVMVDRLFVMPEINKR
jgi:heterodisulfide reductase subunit B